MTVMQKYDRNQLGLPKGDKLSLGRKKACVLSLLLVSTNGFRL